MGVDLDAIECQHLFTLDYLIVVNAGKGGKQVKPMCHYCGVRGSAIKHDLLRRCGIDMGILEVVSNRPCNCDRGCAACSPPCEWPDCGTHQMTELHHYAPQAIFGPQFAARMATAYLCQPHHLAWHVRVTPYLMRRRAA